MEFKLKPFKTDIEVLRIANIHYFEFTKEYHTFNDSHPFCELVYADSGKINISSDSYRGPLNKNNMIIHKALENHSLSCSYDTAPNVIIIGFECKCPQLERFAETPYQLNNDQQSILADVIKEGRNVFLPPYDVPNIYDMKKRENCIFGADQMIKLKLETLFITMIRSVNDYSENIHSNMKSDVMGEIENYIENNFKENITLSDLCFLFGLNKTTLCCEFKNTFGSTVINYINKRRIKEAKRLMRDGGKNLTEVAAESGFSSLHYFSRQFSRYENKSPSEYINTIKSKLMI